MKASRELDALIAERVMRLEDVQRGSDWTGLDWEYFDGAGTGATLEIPEYSTDIAAAWLVVEKLLKDGKEVYLSADKALFSEGFRWVFQIRGVAGGLAPTAPEAICLAALEALGVNSD